MKINKIKFTSFIIFIILVFISVITLYPLLFMFLSSIRTKTAYLSSPMGFPENIYIKNYYKMFKIYNIFTNYRNSFICSFFSVSLTSLLASLSAYVFSKVPFKGSKIIFIFIVSLMMISGQVLIIPMYLLFSNLNLVNNYLSLIIAYTVLLSPYSIYLLTANFSGIPNEILQAAKIDGASFFRIYWSVVMPMGITAVTTVTILNFIWSWNEILLALLMLPRTNLKTLSAALATIIGKYVWDVPLLMTGLFLSIIPIMIIYLILQRYLVQGLTMGAIK